VLAHRGNVAILIDGPATVLPIVVSLYPGANLVVNDRDTAPRRPRRWVGNAAPKSLVRSHLNASLWLEAHCDESVPMPSIRVECQWRAGFHGDPLWHRRIVVRPQELNVVPAIGKPVLAHRGNVAILIDGPATVLPIVVSLYPGANLVVNDRDTAPRRPRRWVGNAAPKPLVRSHLNAARHAICNM